MKGFCDGTSAKSISCCFGSGGGLDSDWIPENEGDSNRAL